MTYRVIIEPPAREDIEVAYRWIAKRAPRPAIQWFNGLAAAIRSLGKHPERCAFAPENDEFEVDVLLPLALAEVLADRLDDGHRAG